VGARKLYPRQMTHVRRCATHKAAVARTLSSDVLLVLARRQRGGQFDSFIFASTVRFSCGSMARVGRLQALSRQNGCRPDRIHNLGAMMRERFGAIRAGIQGQSGGAVAAAGERGGGTRCA
jgi:hypothetical protein